MHEIYSTLRGVNVGGNNKVSMRELKLCFEALGFTQVSTYINSEMSLETTNIDKAKLVDQCEAAIEKSLGLK